MAKAVVVYDHVRFADGDKDHEGRPTFASAYKGDEIDLSQGEFDRLADKEEHPPAGAVASPRSKDAKDAKAEAAAVPESDKPTVGE